MTRRLLGTCARGALSPRGRGLHCLRDQSAFSSPSRRASTCFVSLFKSRQLVTHVVAPDVSAAQVIVLGLGNPRAHRAAPRVRTTTRDLLHSLPHVCVALDYRTARRHNFDAKGEGYQLGLYTSSIQAYADAPGTAESRARCRQARAGQVGSRWRREGCRRSRRRERGTAGPLEDVD
jgi:hypothetical protein